MVTGCFAVGQQVCKLSSAASRSQVSLELCELSNRFETNYQPLKIDYLIGSYQ